MQKRSATHQEILDANYSAVLSEYHRVSYRHFVREVYNPRSANGVSHRQHSRSRLRNIDGVPHVKYQGKLYPVRATHITLDSGYTMIAMIELDSPYLPKG